MTKKSFFKSKLFAILALGALVFNACQQENAIVTEANLNDEFGKFTKELTVSDVSGENSAVLKVGSNDESVLNMWTDENFELVLIKEGQTFDDAMAEAYPLQESEESDLDNLEDNLDDDIVAAEISTIILSKHLNSGIRNIALTTISPYDADMRGWSYSTYYSDAVSDNTVTVNVYGHNRWHRGYWGATYKKYSYSGWSTIVGEWAQIKNGQSDSRTRTPCYQMKARRKYKKGSVTIEFED